MKAKHLLPLLVLITAIVANAAPVPIDPSAYPEPVRVACVGDSITQGAGTHGGMTYPNQLGTILGPKWVVKNFGVSGRTLLKKGDLPYWKEKAFTAAHDFKPNVVIIMLGTNDTKEKNWGHHDEFQADYKELIESFKALDSKPRIFICRPCPVPAPGRFGINEENLQVEMPIIDQLATDESVDIIDMHAALLDKPQMQPDHVHPNNDGAAVMAKTAAAALTGTPQ